jgi:hypothetical protein
MAALECAELRSPIGVDFGVVFDVPLPGLELDRAAIFP